MRNRNFIYWLCQLGGWSLFVLGNILAATAMGTGMSQVYRLSIFILVMGIITTHTFRTLVHKWNWQRYSIIALVPRILISAVVMSLFFTLVNTVLTDIMNKELGVLASVLDKRFLLNALNFSALFLLWNILYFAIKTFENWKREEISNLELRAAKTEIELNSFRSQMNPHFMFNSLNSIRALVDENPDKAKQAITMLSGMMRNNLMLGRKQTVYLKDELDLVEKYLQLEKIRFEERLMIEMDIAPESLSCEVPPFMIQTQVENSIKHGISKITEGGFVHVRSSLENGQLHIVVANSGQMNSTRESDGIGIANTRKRLELLYKGKGQFTIENGKDQVVASLIIPQ
jgi:two-component system, LytTR family, sensor kinase